MKRRQALLMGLAAAGSLGAVAGCQEGAPPGTRVVKVTRQDLVLDVEVAGVLKSLESLTVGPPAKVLDTWEFRSCAWRPRGPGSRWAMRWWPSTPSQLQQKLNDYKSEAAAVSEELGKLRSERSLQVLNDGLHLADAESKQRKADLKAEKPPS